MPSKKPKVSVNKLGEFVYASSIRQKGIVKDQAAERSPGFKAFRYNEARAACVRYFAEGFDLTIIDNAIEALNKKEILNEHDANDQKASIEALNELKNIDLTQFSGLKFERYSGDAKIEISGVDVKVNPDLIIRGEQKKKKVIGAIKIHIIKDSLSSKSQSVVATVLQKFIDEKVRNEDERVLHNLMFSIDIFAGTVHPAPKAQALLLANIEASCDVYRLIWQAL